MKDLESKLPSYTPSCPDTIVYSRIESSRASSVEDVSKFLTNLKSDLKIGEDGYPDKCIVCGDQQTYVIMQNLIKKYPDDFKWILPQPGHWHLLKLAAETLRDLLWDGGLHDLAKECGHHKDLVQWRDVHRMLLGLHESLLYKLSDKWLKTNNEKTFDEYTDSLADDSNADDIGQFCAMGINLTLLNWICRILFCHPEW